MFQREYLLFTGTILSVSNTAMFPEKTALRQYTVSVRQSLSLFDFFFQRLVRYCHHFRFSDSLPPKEPTHTDALIPLKSCEKFIKEQKVHLHILLQKQNFSKWWQCFHWKLCLQKYHWTSNCYCFPMVWVTVVFFPGRHNKSFPEFLQREKRNCLHLINFSTLFLSTLCRFADSSLLTAHLGVLHFPPADNSYQHITCSDAVINRANIKWFRIRQRHP